MNPDKRGNYMTGGDKIIRSRCLSVIIAGGAVAVLGIVVHVASRDLFGAFRRFGMAPFGLSETMLTLNDVVILALGLALTVLLALVARMEQKARQRAREAIAANQQLEKEIVEHRCTIVSLRQAEDKFRSIFETANIGIFQTRPEGRLLTANPALARMLGYDSDDKLLNENASIIDLYHRKADRQEIVRQFEVYGSVHQVEVQFKRQDGCLFWVSLSGHVVRDTAGRLLYYEGTAADITEGRLLENQLRHTQKMDAIGTLTGCIAHDFNNFLTAVNGYASILERKIAKDDPVFNNVKQILAAVDGASRLTRSLLTFSRDQELDQKSMGLNDIITRVWGLLGMLLRKDIEFSTSLTDEPLLVMADSGQIEQVLMNLASNARDAMPNGGILTIGTAVMDIDSEFIARHGFGVPGSYAMLSIADTGTGMDNRTQEKIFEPFFTTKGLGKGTGLGLAISYKIIKQHKGFINCYSEPGRGTTFRIYLPLADAIGEEVFTSTPREIPDLVCIDRQPSSDRMNHFSSTIDSRAYANEGSEFKKR